MRLRAVVFLSSSETAADGSAGPPGWAPGWRFETAPVAPPPLPHRAAAGVTVALLPAEGASSPFWSRAGEPKTCVFALPHDPAAVEAAALHVALWDIGSGTTADPVTLNGAPLPVAGAGNHNTLLRTVTVDPATLRRGRNRLRVLGETTHHGLEILSPGPALAVRVRVPAGTDRSASLWTALRRCTAGRRSLRLRVHPGRVPYDGGLAGGAGVWKIVGPPAGRRLARPHRRSPGSATARARRRRGPRRPRPD